MPSLPPSVSLALPGVYVSSNATLAPPRSSPPRKAATHPAASRNKIAFVDFTRRSLLAGGFGLPLAAQSPKTVVLTFDDAVKSHRTFVGPLLRKLGFGATFFVSHRWMTDPEYFMSWQDIADLNAMGFEIGNHSWTHDNFAVPRNAARLEAELALIDNELKKVAVPKPVSFAYSGNGFGPEALTMLERLGYQYARRGMQPEREYGKIQVGPPYEPDKHDRLLIPTTGDAYPDWTFDHFKKVLETAGPGRYVVLQFHGVPDVKHSWVHTPPEAFERYLTHLKDNGYRVIALRDLAPVARRLPADPIRQARYPLPKDGKLVLAQEDQNPIPVVTGRDKPIAPFHGREHPRVGFLDGAIYPKRGTKAMVFLPWDPDSYLVVDVPEAIFCNLGLLFLAHTHIPTIWDDQNIVIDNVDWLQAADGTLTSHWTLPNRVEFGAVVKPPAGQTVEMELWLRNGSTKALTGLRTQICAMFKRAKGFAGPPELKSATASILSSGRRISIEWERCGRIWGNPNCPCMHSDPVLPDCSPGDTVRVAGRVLLQG